MQVEDDLAETSGQADSAVVRKVTPAQLSWRISC